MVEFTFDSMFRTTNKGLPDTGNLEPYSYITVNNFVYSLIVEIIIGLVITIYSAMAVYRAFYKIKDDRFINSQTPQQQQPQQKSSQDEKDHPTQQQASNTNDNLIYRFDEDESEKDSKEDKKSKDQQEEDENEEQNQEQQQQEQVSEQTTEWYLDLDHKMLFFQPFLISFIVAVNIFASNIILVILLGLALIFFYLFNVKLYGSKKPLLQIIFTLPCIVAFLMVYFDDLDMTT